MTHFQGDLRDCMKLFETDIANHKSTCLCQSLRVHTWLNVSLLFNIAKPCVHTGICPYCIVQHTHAFDINHVMPTIFIAFPSAMFSVLRSLLNAKAVGWVISDTMQPSCTWVQRWWGHTSSGNCLTLPRITLSVASIILSTYQDVA
jgi:hypothetical protein